MLKRLAIARVRARRSRANRDTFSATISAGERRSAVVDKRFPSRRSEEFVERAAADLLNEFVRMVFSGATWFPRGIRIASTTTNKQQRAMSQNRAGSRAPFRSVLVLLSGSIKWVYLHINKTPGASDLYIE